MSEFNAMKSIETYLLEFKETKAETLAGSDFLVQYYDFIQNFFKQEHLQHLTWEDIQKLGENIQAFQTVALSRDALGSQHHPIEHYQKVFTYLAHSEDNLDERIRNILENPDYNLNGFGPGCWGEIIGHLFADHYFLFTFRDQFAVEFLGFDPGYQDGDSLADKYIKFAQSMEPIVSLYKEIVGQQTSVPVHLELNQFFSYLYETYHALKDDYSLIADQITILMDRFKRRMPNFNSFSDPGAAFVNMETAYKRKALKRFQDMIGKDGLTERIASNQCEKTLRTIIRCIGSNLVQYNSWWQSVGKTEATLKDVLQAYVTVSIEKELKPEILEPIFKATNQHDLKPAWDTLSVLLWALNPDMYAPIKMSYYRNLAQELGYDLPAGGPTAENFVTVMNWILAFKTALEPWKPVDMIDVQSFIWVVCPGTHEDVEIDEAPGINKSDEAGTENRRTWLIAPGDRARFWNEWQEENIISVGCDELGDLNQYKNLIQFNQAIQQKLNIENPRNDSLACYQFNQVMKTDDVVLVKRGKSQIIGIGLIQSDYKYDDNRTEYQSYRVVRWLITGEWTIPPNKPIPTKTLTDITGNKGLLEWFYRSADVNIQTLIETPPAMVPETKPDVDDIERQYYWLYINPNIWDPSSMGIGDRQTYTALNERGNKRRIYKYFENAKPGDILIGYVASPVKAITAVFKVTKSLHDSDQGKCIEFELSEKVSEPIDLVMLLSDPLIKECEAFRNSQGSLYSLTEEEFDHIKSMIDQKVLDKEESLRIAELKARLQPYSVIELQKEIYVRQPVLKQWIKALERKKQMIFYGPPGTGKTYVAERLGRYIISGGDGFTQTIQFHPAFSYEDFIQGIRPQVEPDGSISYPMVPGRFMDFCKKARRRTSACVLIIDEINRANLASVFGELTYLLEYRNASIPLAGGGKFQIPPNVRIIGTMNTADRSIALVDHALRRRFAFVPLYPDYNVLRKYHAESDFDIDRFIEQLERLNAEIDNRNYEVGITYFLRENLVQELPDIWQMEIEPYLEEYFFDQPEKLKQFQWNRISEKLEDNH